MIYKAWDFAKLYRTMYLRPPDRSWSILSLWGYKPQGGKKITGKFYLRDMLVVILQLKTLED